MIILVEQGTNQEAIKVLEERIREGQFNRCCSRKGERIAIGSPEKEGGLRIIEIVILSEEIISELVIPLNFRGL